MSVGILAIALWTPSLLSAQRIEGTIRLGGGGGAAAGTILTAFGPGGQTIGTTVVGDDGRYLLYVDEAVATTLRAERVGFLPVELSAGVPSADIPTTFDAEISPDRVSIPSSIPRNANSCGGNANAQRIIRQIITEGQKAMRVAQFRIGRADLEARHVSFQHRTAKNGEDTLRTVLKREAGYLPALFSPLPLEQISRSGFLATVSGERVYHAPDIELFLSDWFESTHCFSVKRTTQDSIVLTFKPAGERRGIVDISGDFTFHRPTLALREISYLYTGLPNEVRLSNAGGAIEFAQTANGNWFASYWHQRTPMVGYRQSDGNTSFIRTQMTLVDVIAHRSIGGRILAIGDGRRTYYQYSPLLPAVAATPFGAICKERAVTYSSAAARGKLMVDSTQSVTAGVRIRGRWEVPVVIDRTEMSTREHIREAITEDDGSWMLCDLPVDRDIFIEWVSKGDDMSRTIRINQSSTVVEVNLP